MLGIEITSEEMFMPSQAIWFYTMFLEVILFKGLFKRYSKYSLICHNRVTNKRRDIFVVSAFMHRGNQEPIGEMGKKEKYCFTVREMKYEIISVNT